MTNTYVDNLDFYEEKINPVDSNQYAFQGSWENFVTKKVTIKLKDGSEVERVLRFTRHGVVVSSFRQIKDKVISMHWVGDEMSNELKTVGQLNRASNWNDFTDALKTFISVSQNVVYADKKGNIGLFCAAGIPIRKRNAVFEILPGWTDEYDWQGFVPFEELPYSYNPDREFVASANNRTVPNDYHYHIGTWYAPPSRYNRIIELLAKEQAFTVEKFKSIQLDEHSKLAEAYLPFFLKALEKATLSSNNEKLAFDMLKKWDYRMDKQSAAAIIFETTYLGFIRCTFEDEMGEALFKRFNGMSVSEIAIDQLLEKGKSPWFDDVTTPGLTEKLDDVILCSFRNTVDVLQNRLGSDPGKWEWGKVHGLLLVHPLASVNILDRVFGLNRGPYAVGGSFHTVAAKSYDWNNPYTVDHGSSQRHIYDLSDWDNSLSVIPTGNSGIPASKHYCDQTILYVNGNYHPDYFSRDKVVEHARYHQTFVGE
jgi:penicillin amidase